MLDFGGVREVLNRNFTSALGRFRVRFVEREGLVFETWEFLTKLYLLNNVGDFFNILTPWPLVSSRTTITLTLLYLMLRSVNRALFFGRVWFGEGN